MVSAEYGGTGGLPLEWGMLVEEPDIEIGAGVSSKAMSRRIATDQGGKRGPQSSRIDGLPEVRRDGRRDERHTDRRHDDRPDSRGNINAAPTNVMPNMPFPFPTLPNGMPMMPPGFQFPFPFPPQQNGDQK